LLKVENNNTITAKKAALLQCRSCYMYVASLVKINYKLTNEAVCMCLYDVQHTAIKKNCI